MHDELERKKILQQGAKTLGLTLSEAQENRLLAYVDLLQTWNKAYNLTAIREPLRMVAEHLLDSLAIAPYMIGRDCLDVGTGAGLPGLPLAIFFPEKAFTLLDSNGKKTRFLTQTVHELGLKNIKVIHSRVEQFSNAGFDVIMSRAVGSIVDLHQSTRHLQQANTQLLLLKGPYPDEEVAAAEKLGLSVQVYPVQVPGVEANRHLVVSKGGLVSG